MKKLFSQTIQRAATWARQNSARARWAVRLLPDLPVTMTLPDIGRVRLRLRRHRSLWLRHPFHHEGLTVYALARLVPANAIVYDLGANIGIFARWLVQRHDATRVIAFEPMTENLRDLRANLALDPRASGRITVVEVALGDRDAEMLLQIDDQMSASARLDQVKSGAAAQGREKAGLPPRTERVTVRRLDTIINELKLPPPDLIKIDIEGAEHFAIEGALETLKSHRPHLIIEIHEEADLTSIVRNLDQLGYAVYSWLPGGWGRLHPANSLSLASLTIVHVVASVDEALLREPISGVYDSA